MTWIWDERGIWGSIGWGRLMTAIEASVSGLEESSVDIEYL